MNRAVFLDRDGVLNEERSYLHRVEDVVIVPGAPGALKRLAGAGFKLFIVTTSPAWVAVISQWPMWKKLTLTSRLNSRDTECDSRKFTSPPKHQICPVGAANHHHNSCSTRGTNSASISRKVLWSATS